MKVALTIEKTVVTNVPIPDVVGPEFDAFERRVVSWRRSSGRVARLATSTPRGLRVDQLQLLVFLIAEHPPPCLHEEIDSRSA